MYIDVVLDEVIWMVNWLHYLNYEPISRTSSTCYLVRTSSNLGQTVTSYGWCNGIPRVVPSFRSFSEQFVSDGLYYRRLESLPRIDIFLLRSGNGFASGRLSYVQAFNFYPCPRYYVTVLVFVCLYVCTTLTITVSG